MSVKKALIIAGVLLLTFEAGKKAGQLQNTTIKVKFE